MSIYGCIQNLLIHGEYSDLTVKCGDRTFNIHRAIVCTQSAVFAKMCDGPWKEAHERVIDLPEDDPTIFDILLSCLYMGDYVDVFYRTSSRPNELALLPRQDVIYYLSQKGSMVPDANKRWDMQCDLQDSFHDEDKGHGTSDHSNNDLFNLDLYNDIPDSDHVDEVLSDNSDTETAESESEASITEDELRIRELELEPTRVEIEKRIQGLSNALHLYIMANKYDVSVARLLACHRFWDLGRKLMLETNDSDRDVGQFREEIYAHFADIVDELYGHTNPHDICIRPVAYALVGSKFLEGDFYDKIRPVMCKHEDFARDVKECMLDVDVLAGDPSTNVWYWQVQEVGRLFKMKRDGHTIYSLRSPVV
ncbi:hypothetical protein SLS62_008338 [Diatrype stigma]|uniref:BTB domain-containing protein n=1 Tax=Diatrype stigma TaxID=117547 RepID=A0AAN9UKH9_9PEZI